MNSEDSITCDGLIIIVAMMAQK